MRFTTLQTKISQVFSDGHQTVARSQKTAPRRTSSALLNASSGGMAAGLGL
jgi:hypothetical protein